MFVCCLSSASTLLIRTYSFHSVDVVETSTVCNSIGTWVVPEKELFPIDVMWARDWLGSPLASVFFCAVVPHSEFMVAHRIQLETVSCILSHGSILNVYVWHYCGNPKLWSMTVYCTRCVSYRYLIKYVYTSHLLTTNVQKNRQKLMQNIHTKARQRGQEDWR